MDGNRNKLHRELIALFGRQRVERAKALDIADLLLPELEPLNLSELEPLPDVSGLCSMLEPSELTPIELPPVRVTAATMQAVEAAADALLKESGRPHRQRELVDALDNETALLLCMWLMDTGKAGQLLGAAA